MKKIFFALIAMLLVSSLSFADTELTKVKITEKKELTGDKTSQKAENNSEKEDICTIGCSVVVNGVTYSTSAGGLFTSCREAGNQCLRKLAELSANLEP